MSIVSFKQMNVDQLKNRVSMILLGLAVILATGCSGEPELDRSPEAVEQRRQEHGQRMMDELNQNQTPHNQNPSNPGSN